MNKYLPAFSKIDLNHTVLDLKQILTHNLENIDKLLNQNQPFTWDNLMYPLEELDDKLHQFWSPISHLHGVADSELMRKIYGECISHLTEYNMAISHNKKLFSAIQSIASSSLYEKLNNPQRKVIEHQIRDFKLAGVALDEIKQHQFSDIVKALSQLSTKFEENVLDATKAWTKHITHLDEIRGLPPFAINSAAASAKQQNQTGWLLNLEPPTYRAVITYADSSELRKEIYAAYVTRASDQGPCAGKWDNRPVINQILTKRLEAAKLLGFNNFAEESLATKMAESPSQVVEFLHDLLSAALPRAKEEFTELKTFVKNHYGLDNLESWDIAYYSEKLRQHDFAISQEELRPYFSESKVLAGLFTIIKRLYAMEVKPVNDADIWHEDVKCYALYDASHELRSYFYLDLYSRPSKRGGAWMDDCRVRRKRVNNEIQLPIAFVNCNFSGPTENMPALFTHDDVVTLFHEFGHALHHILTKVDYADISGINGVPWDAVEFPSQFFENWAWERESLDFIAEHFETKLPLPQELYEKMQRAKNFQSAMHLLRQAEFALYDFRLHMEYNPLLSDQAQSILESVRSKFSLYPVPPFNRFQNSFSHIFAGGYAAGYYSYHWAEVLACDAFEIFKEKGIFDSETSQRFLNIILEKGGSEEPMQLFTQFRGRPPEIDAMLRQQGIIE